MLLRYGYSYDTVLQMFSFELLDYHHIHVEPWVSGNSMTSHAAAISKELRHTGAPRTRNTNYAVMTVQLTDSRATHNELKIASTNNQPASTWKSKQAASGPHRSQSVNKNGQHLHSEQATGVTKLWGDPFTSFFFFFWREPSEKTKENTPGKQESALSTENTQM